MSVTRINEFHAAEGQTRRLRDLLTSVVVGVEGSNECLSCRLLQNLQDQTRFVILEVPGVEAHESSVENVSQDELQDVMRVFASPAQGRYLTDADAA